MAANRDYRTTSINISTKKVEVMARDIHEFPKAVKKDGRFITPWDTQNHPPTGMDNFKYFFTKDEAKVPSAKKLDKEPLMAMSPADPQILNPPEDGVRATWLGHVSTLLQFDGVNFLINPNFNHKGIKFYHANSSKRYRPPVYKVDDLPRIDGVFITNTHYDYLDLNSVKMLTERFGEMLLWYVPMGVADWMSRAGCRNVIELDWWKEDEVSFVDYMSPEDEEESASTTFSVMCTPSQNYHYRCLDDDNAALWCGWVILSPRYKLYVSGATGYNDVIFKSIGKRYGPFHLAVLPIGGYHPSWKNSFGNVNPEEAVQVHQDVQAMCSLGVSWGTFTVSNEPYLEPPQRLSEELCKQVISEMEFFVLKHGESRLIEGGPMEKGDNDDYIKRVLSDNSANNSYSNVSLSSAENSRDNSDSLPGSSSFNAEIDAPGSDCNDITVDVEVEVSGDNDDGKSNSSGDCGDNIIEAACDIMCNDGDNDAVETDLVNHHSDHELEKSDKSEKSDKFEKSNELQKSDELQNSDKLEKSGHDSD